MTTHAITFNPFDPEVINDPYPFYAALRGDNPIYHIPELGFHVLLSYAANDYALRNPAQFSSSVVSMVLTGQYNPVPEDGLMLLNADPPEHTRLRRLISPRFTPKAVAAMCATIEGFVDEALETMCSSAEFDFNAILAKPLPIQTFFTLAGVPRSQHAQCKAWSDAIIEASRYAAGQQLPDAETDARLRRATEEYEQFLRDLVASRQEHPADDLTSGLVHAVDEGDMYSEVEVRKMLHLLVIAGTESTQKLLANMVLTFAKFPDQYRRVVEDRSLIPNAVREVLRYEGSGLHMPRLVTEDVELFGTVIPANTLCLIGFASANRDPEKFENPEVFDVTRDPRGALAHHMGFGAGIHRCLGAHLATLQTEIVLEKLVEAFPNGFSWDPEQMVRDDVFFMRGPVKLVVSAN
ncbi:cytochrome P450 [Mycobacterium sp.]|uniref:cytochrome P450 n=1 Tax=Mycobacterium sp. TaxID=1785 RepID=UPI003C789A5D